MWAENDIKSCVHAVVEGRNPVCDNRQIFPVPQTTNNYEE